MSVFTPTEANNYVLKIQEANKFERFQFSGNFFQISRKLFHDRVVFGINLSQYGRWLENARMSALYPWGLKLD